MRKLVTRWFWRHPTPKPLAGASATSTPDATLLRRREGSKRRRPRCPEEFSTSRTWWPDSKKTRTKRSWKVEDIFDCQHFNFIKLKKVVVKCLIYTFTFSIRISRASQPNLACSQRWALVRVQSERSGKFVALFGTSFTRHASRHFRSGRHRNSFGWVSIFL